MKKTILSLYSLISISATSSMVVSCGAPEGNAITVEWNSPPSDAKLDTQIIPSVLLPTFNMLNSTKESRKESIKENDGMTDNQIQNSLEFQQNDLENKSHEKDTWKKFYKYWSSSSNYSYSNIALSSGDGSPLVEVQSWDDKGKPSNKIITTDNVKKSLDYLNTNYCSEYAYSHGMNFAYVNLNSNDPLYGKSNVKATLKFNAGFSFDVNISHLVAEVALSKMNNNKYAWSLMDYDFVDEAHYPSNSFDTGTGGLFFGVWSSPASDSDSKYNFKNLDYTIDSDSIKQN